MQNVGFVHVFLLKSEIAKCHVLCYAYRMEVVKYMCLASSYFCLRYMYINLRALKSLFISHMVRNYKREMSDERRILNFKSAAESTLFPKGNLWHSFPSSKRRGERHLYIETEKSSSVTSKNVSKDEKYSKRESKYNWKQRWGRFMC